jgi:restriction system protein
MGYEAKTNSYVGDYGVDVFATKGKEKVAIQVKMYGGGTRKINRQMIMELHGAKDYFDCSKAVIATDGTILKDAKEVANKLKIDILYIDSGNLQIFNSKKIDDNSFDSIWSKYIIPLKGKTLVRDNNETNEILNVNWSEVERLTSNGNKSKIKIEIFKQAINKLMIDGSITRDYINQNYVGRASSGVILILSQVPFFKRTEKPTGLKYFK